MQIGRPFIEAAGGCVQNPSLSANPKKVIVALESSVNPHDSRSHSQSHGSGVQEIPTPSQFLPSSFLQLHRVV
jgi:hypothetical protein